MCIRDRPTGASWNCIIPGGKRDIPELVSEAVSGVARPFTLAALTPPLKLKIFRVRIAKVDVVALRALESLDIMCFYFRLFVLAFEVSLVISIPNGI